MSNYPAGVGMYDIPGFRDEDVSAQLRQEAWEESIDADKIAAAMLDYVKDDWALSEFYQGALLFAFARITQRMADSNLPELAKLGAYFGLNKEAAE